jgi:Fe-S-cluster containining protein
MNIDEWFAKVRSKYAAHMQCGKGCTACCHGLFDITLADAVEVARGFQKLPADVQQRVRSRALELDAAIAASGETLFDEDDPRIDRIVDGANNPPCPCLGDAGECLIYEHRPMACRLEGVPMVDVRDGLFGDWCELNFKDGIPETALRDLTQDYEGIETAQESRSDAVAERAGLPNPRAVTFIPSVIAEYDSFWRRLPSYSRGAGFAR